MNFDGVAQYRAIEQLWAAQRWDDWRQTVAPGYQFEPGIGPKRDIDGTLAWSRALFAAFPDLSQEVLHVLPGDGEVAGVTICRGTHKGPLNLGLGGALRPAGKSFAFTYIKVLRFDDAGRVTHDRQFLDPVDLMNQLTQ